MNRITITGLESSSKPETKANPSASSVENSSAIKLSKQKTKQKKWAPRFYSVSL